MSSLNTRKIKTTENIFKQHLISKKVKANALTIGENNLILEPTAANSSGFFYKRFSNGKLSSESMIASDEDPAVVGVFPSPPTLTPKHIADNVYLKFKSSIIVDQKSDIEFFTTMPIEIAVFRQSRDEEILLDAFSLSRQQYALYGPPEKGFVCRFKEVHVNTNRASVKPEKYAEALVKIMVRNDSDNIVKINKVIIPVNRIILDHANDDTWLPGSVEMSLSQTFGQDVVNVQLVDTKIKPIDKTSIAGKEDSLVFLMDAGY